VLDKLADRGAIRAEQFGIVIADESHQLKNKDAKRTEIALPFIKRATVAICLSGTPILNRPVEMYTQLNALLPRVFSSYEEFTQRYCNARPANFGSGWDVSGSSNERELNLLLEGIVMVRRLKADVVKSLPTKRREIRYIKPDAAYVGQLHAIQKDQQVVMAALQSSGSDAQIVQKLKREQQQLTLRYNQVTGISKVAGVSDIIRELIAKARLPHPEPPASDLPTDADASASSTTATTTVPTDSAGSSCQTAPMSVPDTEGKGVVLDLTGGEDADTEVIRPTKVIPTLTSGTGAVTSRPIDAGMEDCEDDLLFAEASVADQVREGGGLGHVKKEDEDWMRDSDEECNTKKKSKSDAVTRKGTRAALREEKAGLSRLKRNARRTEAEAEGDDGADVDDAEEPALKRRSLRSSTLHRRVAYCPEEDEEEDGGAGSDEGLWSAGPRKGGSRVRRGAVDEEDVGLIEMDSDGDDLFFLDKPSANINGKRKTSEKRSRVQDGGDDEEFDCVDWDGGSDGDGGGGGVDQGARRSAQLWRDILDGKGRGASESSRRRGKKSPEAAQTSSIGASGGNGKALKATEKAGATASLFKRKSKLHQKILIFAHHREVMNRLEDCLREEQVDYFRLDGSVGTASRNTYVLDFQQNDEVSIE
jgi:hypothetical protein